MTQFIAMFALFAATTAPEQAVEDLAAAQEVLDQEEVILFEDAEVQDLQEIVFDDECDSYANPEDIVVEN